jgi:hypothetical protein
MEGGGLRLGGLRLGGGVLLGALSMGARIGTPWHIRRKVLFSKEHHDK